MNVAHSDTITAVASTATGEQGRHFDTGMMTKPMRCNTESNTLKRVTDGKAVLARALHISH
jgi:hypothetical protein